MHKITVRLAQLLQISKKKYDLKIPTTISIKGDLDGEKTIHPLSLEAISDGIEELKHNPYINLVISDK